MRHKKFIKKTENFTCSNCGYFARGNGFTNHCPKCLWSRHVDINPGDRSSKCKGLMEPAGVEVKKDSYIIIHQCLNCGTKRRNRSGKSDSFNEILKYSANIY